MRQVVKRGDQTLIVTSSGRPQHMVTWEELPKKDQQFFDYIEDEQKFDVRFAKHRGSWVDVFDMETTWTGLSAPDPGVLAKLGWDGVQTESHWSGIVAKVTYGGESVVMGRFVIEG